jgi:hypothetical protein
MEALCHSDTPWLDVLAAKFMVVNDLVSLMHELNKHPGVFRGSCIWFILSGMDVNTFSLYFIKGTDYPQNMFQKAIPWSSLTASATVQLNTSCLSLTVRRMACFSVLFWVRLSASCTCIFLHPHVHPASSAMYYCLFGWFRLGSSCPSSKAKVAIEEQGY